MAKVKVIDAGVSSKHAGNWTVGEAIRELVQNWIDVKSEFGGAASITWEGGVARIKDSGPGLQLSHLAFGENAKAAGSIGQFGEGMKSAFITLLREGRSIEIKSNGLVIRPVFRTSANFKIETLHYRVAPMTARLAARLKGTVMRVECTQEELDIGKSYFGYFKIRNNEVEWLEKGKISLPGGNVWVKGSIIGKIPDAHFSYHLSGEVAERATNRDRNAVDMAVIQPEIEKMIAITSSMKVREQFIYCQYTGRFWEGRLQLNSVYAPQVWKRVFNQTYDTRLVLSYDSDWDRQAEYRGYKILNVGSQANFFRAIGVPMSYEVVKIRNQKPSLGILRMKDLTEVHLKNFKWARQMVKKHYADTGKVKIVKDLKPLVGGHLDAQGVYRREKDTIYLQYKCLNTKEKALHVLLHETVHKVSRESDLTAEFEKALLDVAVRIIKNREKSYWM